VVADDSGLEVEALGGVPGIFSARYAGENANDRRNVEKLLRELQDARDRSARFYCVIALAKNGQLMTTVAGEVAGTITKSPVAKTALVTIRFLCRTSLARHSPS
jgi:Xanthosine triphosphate pyrophosphatase